MCLLPSRDRWLTRTKFNKWDIRNLKITRNTWLKWVERSQACLKSDRNSKIFMVIVILRTLLTMITIYYDYSI